MSSDIHASRTVILEPGSEPLAIEQPLYTPAEVFGLWRITHYACMAMVTAVVEPSDPSAPVVSRYIFRASSLTTEPDTTGKEEQRAPILTLSTPGVQDRAHIFAEAGLLTIIRAEQLKRLKELNGSSVTVREADADMERLGLSVQAVRLGETALVGAAETPDTAAEPHPAPFLVSTDSIGIVIRNCGERDLMVACGAGES